MLYIIYVIYVYCIYFGCQTSFLLNGQRYYYKCAYSLKDRSWNVNINWGYDDMIIHILDC